MCMCATACMSTHFLDRKHGTWTPWQLCCRSPLSCSHPMTAPHSAQKPLKCCPSTEKAASPAKTAHKHKDKKISATRTCTTQYVNIYIYIHYENKKQDKKYIYIYIYVDIFLRCAWCCTWYNAQTPPPVRNFRVHHPKPITLLNDGWKGESVEEEKEGIGIKAEKEAKHLSAERSHSPELHLRTFSANPWELRQDAWMRTNWNTCVPDPTTRLDDKVDCEHGNWKQTS